MHLSPTESSTRGWETPQRICSYQRCLMWSEERTFWRRWRAQGRLFYRAFTHCRYGHLRLYPHMTGSSQVPQLNMRCFKRVNGSIMWTFIVHLRGRPNNFCWEPEPVIDLVSVMSVCFEAVLVDWWYLSHCELYICLLSRFFPSRRPSTLISWAEPVARAHSVP